MIQICACTSKPAMGLRLQNLGSKGFRLLLLIKHTSRMGWLQGMSVLALTHSPLGSLQPRQIPDTLLFSLSLSGSSPSPLLPSSSPLLSSSLPLCTITCVYMEARGQPSMSSSAIIHYEAWAHLFG